MIENNKQPKFTLEMAHEIWDKPMHPIYNYIHDHKDKFDAYSLDQIWLIRDYLSAAYTVIESKNDLYKRGYNFGRMAGMRLISGFFMDTKEFLDIQEVLNEIDELIRCD